MTARQPQPAEYYSRLYMAQPWGATAAMAYRHLLAQIRIELHSPLSRCSACEEPYIPTVVAWPERVTRKHAGYFLRRRYLLCPHCGHLTPFYERPLQHPPIFTRDQVQEMWELYDAGITPTEIGRRMGCHSGTVRRYLRLAGKPLRPQGGSRPLRGVPHAELETIRFLYEKLGWRQKDIANYLQMSRHVIQSRVTRGGMVRFGKIPPPKKKKPAKRKTAVSA